MQAAGSGEQFEFVDMVPSSVDSTDWTVGGWVKLEPAGEAVGELASLTLQNSSCAIQVAFELASLGQVCCPKSWVICCSVPSLSAGLNPFCGAG